jgi:hypothetical protein
MENIKIFTLTFRQENIEINKKTSVNRHFELAGI